MKSKWMWLLGVATAVAVGSSLMIPAAVGAAPTAKAAVQGSCKARGTKPLGNTGVISVSAKGSVTTGTPGACTAKLTGTWAKNSKTFALDATGKATLGKGGAWVLAPGTAFGPLTHAKLVGTLTGTGNPVGTAMTISINCVISYPPLKIVCTIIIDFGSSAMLHKPAVVSAPQTATDTPLCTAKGVKPVGNTGVISLTAKGKGPGTAGTPATCTAKVVGQWKKNSTTFSFNAIGGSTLRKGGLWTLDPKTSLSPLTGKVTGTLLGSGLPTGSAIWVELHCWFKYPPLNVGCEVIIHTGPPPTG